MNFDAVHVLFIFLYFGGGGYLRSHIFNVDNSLCVYVVCWQSNCVFLPRFCLSVLDNLCNGKFHKHLQDLFAPLVVRYVDLMESSIAQSIHRGFERESWEPVK